MPASVATMVVPARNCTWVTVVPAPDPGSAVAVRVTGEPAVTTEPGSGAEMEIVGAELLTVTVIVADVAVIPFESTAWADNVAVPAVVGVHGNVYGTLAAEPSKVAPSKKSTRVMVAPAAGVAEALSVTAVPTVAVELLAGAVRATVVAVTAVTDTAVDVAVLPFVSVTRAVRLKFVALVGVHVTEYGAVVSVPMIVAPARN